MHISILLMEQIIELFIMILMGFIIVKAGIVKDEDSKVLSKIVLYLIIPCVIINAFQVDYTSKTVRGLLYRNFKGTASGAVLFFSGIHLFAKSTACLAKTFFDWFARRKSGKW